jgi:hypothetical protein
MRHCLFESMAFYYCQTAAEIDFELKWVAVDTKSKVWVESYYYAFVRLMFVNAGADNFSFLHHIVFKRFFVELIVVNSAYENLAHWDC